MNDKVKKILIPLILTIIVDEIYFQLGMGRNFAGGIVPDLGLIPVLGILFGPYGALGCALGMFISDMSKGYSPLLLTRVLIPFSVSYLSYKLWYGSFESKHTITKPRFNNTSNILMFLGIILLTATIFATINKKIVYLAYPEIFLTAQMGLRFFVNFVNFSFVYGVIGIWLSKRIDFIHVPKKSEKYNEQFYKIILILLTVSSSLIAIIDFFIAYNNPEIGIIEITFLTILMVIYLTKPINVEIKEITIKPLPETITKVFLSTAMIIAIIGILLAGDIPINDTVTNAFSINFKEPAVATMLMADILFVIFFIPAFAVLRYVENKVINPIVSFSKVEKFIKKGDKIEKEAITDLYSKYLDENNEIGMLARSYTDLINYGNDYLENIREDEIEKERDKTELRIAENIQKSILPTESVDNENYTLYGISKPAKEVGGDFYNYYPLDEDNMAVMFGNASGKRVAAALLSTIVQSILEQTLKREKDPSKALYLLNNQLCENNPDMHVSLWAGIYNEKTKTMTFTNAGHDGVLINENGKFTPLKMDENVLLGIKKDYEFTTEKITISNGILTYTNGILGMKNSRNEPYDQYRLMNFINHVTDRDNLINKIFEDIDEFSDCEKQIDDMTFLYLEIHD